MRVGNFDKQPDERRRLAINYTHALAQGDIVLEAELKSVVPSDELTVDTLTVESPQVLFFIEGGAHRTSYVVTVATTTGIGEVFEDEILVSVIERD